MQNQIQKSAKQYKAWQFFGVGFMLLWKEFITWYWRNRPVTTVGTGLMFFLAGLFAHPQPKYNFDHAKEIGIMPINPLALPTVPVKMSSLSISEKICPPEVPEKESAAPAVPKMTETTAEFVQRFSGVAITMHHKYGVPASIQLAQGIVESNSGHSKLVRVANNYFGVKCFATHCKAGHCVNQTDDSHKDFFRKYGNAWESWSDHGLKCSTGRYHKLKSYGNDYKKWAIGLQRSGYATDKTYASKLIQVIQANQLQRYDR